MARTTMTVLIDQVRSMVMLTETEFSIGTMNFWDNDQIQKILDAHRTDFRREELAKVQDHAGGSIAYFEYRSQYTWLEQTDAGTAIFFIEDAAGNDIGTALWSANYQTGIVTFGSNTLGTAYYLTGRRFDIFGAAADIARRQANYYSKSYDIQTDGHRLNRSQLRDQFLEMAKDFEMKSDAETFDFIVE